MKTSDDVTELVKALIGARATFPPLVNNRVGQVGDRKYPYADLGAIMDSVAAPLADAGLALVHAIERDNGAVGLVTRLFHSSGQWLESTYPLPDKATPQQFGSALTYGRRYSAAALLAIVADDDDDGHAASREIPATVKPTVATKAAAKPAVARKAPDAAPEAPETWQGEIVAVVKGKSDKAPWTIEGADGTVFKTFETKLKDGAEVVMESREFVEVGYESKSREYNGKTYTDLMMLSISSAVPF